jgi:hypothetical protein
MGSMAAACPLNFMNKLTAIIESELVVSPITVSGRDGLALDGIG